MVPNRKQLFFILLLALGVRLWGVWHVSTTDEYNEVLEALRVCSGHFNLERWVKRFYLYILAAEYGAYYILGWLSGEFTQVMDFAEKIIRYMEPLFIIARLTSVVAGTLTVGVVYLTGVRFFRPETGALAACLLAVTVFHVELSQQAKVDALLGFLVASSLYFTLKILSDDDVRRWDFAWTGLLAALATQTKINAVILVVPLFLVIVLKYKRCRSSVVAGSIFFALFFILGFILGNPAVLISPITFATSILGLHTVYTTAVNEVPNDIIGFLAYPLYYYRSLGAVIALVTIMAFLDAVLKPNARKTVLVSFIIPFYLLMGSTKNLVASYYMIPALPFLFLLVGDFMLRTWEKVSSSKRLTLNPIFRSVLLYSMILISFIHPMINLAYHELSLSGENTRQLAKRWIENNIPPGSKILMDSGKSINSFAPLISENRESLERTLAMAKTNIKEGRIVHGMVDTNALIYYELLLKTVPSISYDITSTMFGLHVESIDYYVLNHYQYFVISDSMRKSRVSPSFRQDNPAVANFYESLSHDTRITAIKTIAPSRFNLGDTFYIYSISHNCDTS